MVDQYINKTGSRPLPPDNKSGTNRWEHRFSQSLFNTFSTCPEQARAIYFREVKSQPTSHSVRGSAMHAGIEYLLHAKLNGAPLDLDEATQVAHHECDLYGDWKYTGISRANVYEDQHGLLHDWLTHVEPLVRPLHLEWSFDYLLYSGKHRDVRVVGSIDCIDENYEVWDWKSGSREYVPWEKQRWAVQPTVYGFAVQQLMAGTDPINPYWEEIAEPLTFHYAIMLGNNDVQLLDVTRDEGHVAWLRQQASQIAWMVENMPDGPWPLNDAHALCSAKWCPLWDSCKGSHLI